MATNLVQFVGCPTLDCPGTDYPVSNFSSEVDDGVEFVSMHWPVGNGGVSITGSFGGGGPGAPLGGDPTGWPCVGMANSLVSQFDADLCSELDGQTCGLVTGDCPPPFWPTNDPTVDPNTPVQSLGLFYNNAQTCSAECANGSKFTYTIRAGVIANASQITADRIAYSLVCQHAQQQKVCIVPSPHRPGRPLYDPLHLVGGLGWCCNGETLTGEPVLSVTGPGFTFAVSSGSLPGGITMAQDSDTSVAFSGQFNTPGNYNFTITASNAFGQSVSQNFNVQIIGFQSGSLADGQVGDRKSVV